MDRIRVLVVADELIGEKYRTILEDNELEIVGSVYDEDDVLEMITKTNAQIALVDDDGSSRFYRCCQQIYMLRPRTVPVAVMKDQSMGKIERLLQTGVHHMLPDGMSGEDFSQALKSILVNESTRIVSLENTSGEQNKSRVIMVYGAKDGIGKTAFAVNLAISLAQAKQKVAILDLDLQYGDVNVFVGLESKTSISELLQEQTSPSIDLIRRHMVIHSSGVNILCAPRSPEFAEGISGPQVEKLIAAMRSYFDYVVLDTPPLFNDVNVSCIDAASVIVYLTACDISALRNSRKGLYLLQALTRKEKIRLVAVESDMKPAVVAKTLELPVYATIPYDYKTVTTSLNLGRPAVTSAPASKYSKAIKGVSALVNSDGGGLERNKDKKSILLRRKK